MATEIKCEKKVIREIFNMWYCIPDYQRAYVWDTDQVRDLLDDTISAYRENKEAQYFLGSMVLKINEKSENNVSYTEYELLDGQQRITTVFLILACMRDIPRKPDEQIEVDWTGDPAHIIDPDTGEITDAWIFVGVLTYSQYAFVKAYMNEKTDNWIKAHVQMFDFFGGVTPMLVSDNCTTAVNHKKSDWYNTALNTTYREMAEHYNLAILPERVRKPKDKPNVKGSVGKISTWITAALRNEQFFSLAELNSSIREKLDAYNARKFQKKECSRLSLFLGEEMPLLAPLPATPFELAEWKQATIQFNYHIAVDRMFYSVPYQYIKNKVDVRITDTTVEILYNHNRIASHRRLYGRSGQYSTVTEHMPQEHQKYLEWNGDRFRKWADSIEINTSKVVDAILTSGRIEQQSYRSCMGLLKLAEKYSPERLEQICAKALSYSGKPSYKSIKNLLAAAKDVLVLNQNHLK